MSFGKKGFKYFVGYNTKMLKNRPLLIFLPKMTTYRKDFYETKFMSFFIKDDELLEKYYEIWQKVKDSLKKEFDCEPIYNKKYLKAKIKSFNEKTNTNFHNNKIPKEDSQYICLWVTLINSAFRTGKNYYPQVFLVECKYIPKEIPKYIIDDIEISSDSERENSDEENQKNTGITHILNLFWSL